jgi:DUF1680 family protein
MVYATQGNYIYVNLFMSNNASIPINGKMVEIRQETAYPWDGTVRIAVKTEKPQDFTLKIRIPGWARNEVAPGGLYSFSNAPSEQIYRILLNGEDIQSRLNNGYVDISREWTGNDRVELVLPMKVRQVKASEQVKDDLERLSIEYGPLVYCAEEIDNETVFEQTAGLPHANYMVEMKPDLLGGVNVIGDGTSTFIPYYAWSNRGIGKMKVWMDK